MILVLLISFTSKKNHAHVDFYDATLVLENKGHCCCERLPCWVLSIGFESLALGSIRSILVGVDHQYQAHVAAHAASHWSTWQAFGRFGFLFRF
jgi:hypothetical protein